MDNILKPPSRDDYIFAQRQNRERVAINRLIADQMGMLRDVFGPNFGWALSGCWLGLRIPQRRLLRGLDLPANKLLGDVDVFGASLQPASQEEFNSFIAEAAETYGASTHPSFLSQIAAIMVLERGRTKWPPDLSYIAATEVKVSYYDADDTLKATGAGSQQSDRTQAKRLCEMGFDRVGLVRIIVTEPVAPSQMHPWFEAGARSSHATDELQGKQVRIAQDDPFGTVLISIGTVPGGLEDMRGSLSWEWLLEAPENRFKIVQWIFVTPSSVI